MKEFLKEFRKFIMRGNVLDLAIGVVIATSFTKITNSLVNDIIMPILGKIIGGVNLSYLNICIQKPEVDPITNKVIKDGVYIGIGDFLVSIIDFIIIAFVLFVVIKSINKASSLFIKQKKEAEIKKGSTQEEILTEILEEIKKK